MITDRNMLHYIYYNNVRARKKINKHLSIMFLNSANTNSTSSQVKYIIKN